MGMNLQSQISKVVTKFCMWKLKFKLILFQGLSHASAANSHSTQSTKLKVIWPGIWKHLNQFLVNSALSLPNLGKTCKLCAQQYKCRICKREVFIPDGWCTTTSNRNTVQSVSLVICAVKPLFYPVPSKNMLWKFIKDWSSAYVIFVAKDLLTNLQSTGNFIDVVCLAVLSPANLTFLLSKSVLYKS